MIEEKENIIMENTEKVSQLVRAYVEEIDAMSETDDFTIDKIEKLWEKLGASAEEVYREIGRKVIEQIDERKAIKLKKASMHRKG